MTKAEKNRYLDAVAWIAMNDDPMTIDVKSVRQNLTTCLVADVFSVDEKRVAADVVRYRKTLAKNLRIACERNARARSTAECG